MLSSALDERGTLRLTREAGGVAVVEELALREEGLEQSWRFAERPTGTGDLVVRVRADGLRYHGETAGGLHFLDEKCGLGVRYGVATWVDANDVRTELRPRFEAGTIVLRVPAATVDGSAFPAVLDPIIGAEFGMDTPVIVPAGNDQVSPRVAFDGTNFLAVWQDGRYSIDYPDILGTRIKPDGTVLDTTGIAISFGGLKDTAPAVACDGTNCLVVWVDTRYGDNDIFGARVRSSDGVVLDPAQFAIVSTIASQTEPSIAWNGTNYLVAWTDGSSAPGSPTDVRATRVSNAKRVYDMPTIVVSNAMGDQRAPSVTAGAGKWLVAWEDGRGMDRDLYATFIHEDGTNAQPMGIVVSGATGDERAASTAFDGTNFLVAWQDARLMGDLDIRASRIAPDGTVLDPMSFTVAMGAGAQTTPAASFDGMSYLVAWDHDEPNAAKRIDAARLKPDGTLLDVMPLAVAPDDGADRARPAVGSGGGQSLVAWQDAKLGAQDIFAVRLGQDGVVRDMRALALATSANTELAPVAAWNGTHHLVVWHDERNGPAQADLWGVLAKPDGTVVDATGFAVVTAPGVQTAPAVASDGTNFLVVWQDARGGAGQEDIYGVRLKPDGTLLDMMPFAISTGMGAQLAPQVVWNGAGYLVVWQDKRGMSADIYAARVQADGTVMDMNGIPVSTAMGDQIGPSLAWDGASFVIAWADRRTGNGDVYAARLQPDGTLLDMNGILVSARVGDESATTVASDGKNTLVVWRDATPGVADLYGRRMKPDGTLLDMDAFVVNIANGLQDRPAAVFDGSFYVVAWEDHRMPGRAAIFGVRVQPDNGALLEPRAFGFSIASAIGDVLTPRLSTDGADHTLAVYRYVDYAAGLRSPRVRGRFITEPPNFPPMARCMGATLIADATCKMMASVDNMSSDPDGNLSFCKPMPEGPYGSGPTDVTLTCTDSLGLTASCTAKVTVVDQTPPTITCPMDYVTGTAAMRCDATLAEMMRGKATAQDNCGAMVSVTGLPKGEVFALGDTTLTFTATDGAGGTASCKQKVTVRDMGGIL